MTAASTACDIMILLQSIVYLFKVHLDLLAHQVFLVGLDLEAFQDLLVSQEHLDNLDLWEEWARLALLDNLDLLVLQEE